MSYTPNNPELYRKTNLFGAWCGVIYVAVLLLAWWFIAQFFPLHEPSANAEAIYQVYQENLFGIRLGMILIMWCAAIFLPFAATVADYVARVEGGPGPLSTTTKLAGYANAMLTFYPPLWWLTAAFRPDVRSADLLYMLNDAAWLQFIGGLSLVMPIYVTVAVAILSDKSSNPVFPRWMAFFCLWTFVLLIPDQLLFFFKDGPFAWDGIFAFWVPLTVFAGWFIAMFYFLRKAYLKTV